MPRLPEDPEPVLRKTRERAMVLGPGVFTVKTGFAVVRDPRLAAEIGERQEQAVRALLEWHREAAGD
jgi:hypothetical protein